jgi:hypothetical protein
MRAPSVNESSDTPRSDEETASFQKNANPIEAKNSEGSTKESQK